MLSTEICVHGNGPKYCQINFLNILKIIVQYDKHVYKFILKIHNEKHPLKNLGKDMNASFSGVQKRALDLLKLELHAVVIHLLWVLGCGLLQQQCALLTTVVVSHRCGWWEQT